MSHRLVSLLLGLIATLALLQACASAPGGDAQPSHGRVSGTIVVAAGHASSGVVQPVAGGASSPSAVVPAPARPIAAANGAPPATADADPTTTRASGEPYALAPDADIVPGEIIVRFSDAVRTASVTTLDVGGVSLRAVRPLALPQTQLYRAAVADGAAIAALAAELAARADVVYAHPNLVLRPLRAPDDPLYPLQWHYPAIGLPAAWDVTTGSAEVVVAVIDTGILHRAGVPSQTHPDLAGRVLPGYDFISDPAVAGDGDGRDPDPYDVGDNPGGQSSYHGTHVAATVGAASDDGTGAAGVDWRAGLLPVRALGIGGGSLVDVIEGALWAAGFSIAGVPANAHPAHVLNLSLGGSGACPPFAQDAFDAIAAGSSRRTIVVVAAGNENQSVANSTPANCGNVVAVGATDLRGWRAPYSNYGTRVDVMAPGGDLTEDRNGDGHPDGVLSATRIDGPGGGFDHAWYEGTSMAAPHVAGVLALMKALDGELTLTEALAVLTDTARGLSASECGRPSGAECGAGLIDAAAAVRAVRDGAIPTPGDGAIAYDPNPVDYGAVDVVRSIRLSNTGDAGVDWALAYFQESPDNPGTMLDGSVAFAPGAPTSGWLAPGASVTTAIEIDRSLVTAPGAYTFALLFEVDGVDQPLTVRFRTAPPPPEPRGPMAVFTLVENDSGDIELGGLQESSGFLPAFDFATRAGANTVFAWSDENRNGVLDDGDLLGFYPAVVWVSPGRSVPNLDFAVSLVVGTGAADTDHAKADHAKAADDDERVPAWARTAWRLRKATLGE